MKFKFRIEVTIRTETTPSVVLEGRAGRPVNFSDEADDAVCMEANRHRGHQYGL